MCKIEIEGVTITLTKDQLDIINQQINKITNFNQITSHKDACKVLGKEYKEDIHPYFKLKDIGKAINLLTKNKSNYRHYPVFKTGSAGLVYCDSYCYSTIYHVGVVYLDSEEGSNYIGTKFIHLYKEIIEDN